MSNSAVEAISITDFMEENWEKFEALESIAEKELTNITRTLPPDFHTIIQHSIFELFAFSAFGEELKVRVILDSNIIIQDAFRVAQGKYSNTDRILASPYLEVLAPTNIKDEVEEQIIKKLPKGASEEIALKHACELLSKIDTITDAAYPAINEAQSHIGDHSPEDVPFLALAFETKSKAIVSKDKRAFDRQTVIERWGMKRTVEVVVSYESGCLSLVVVGGSIEMLIEGFDNLLVLLLDAIEKAVEIIAIMIAGLISGSLDFISDIPEWAWAIIAIVGIGTIIAAIFHEGFRAWLGNGIKKIGETLGEIIEKTIQAVKTLWEAFKIILIWIWNFMVPIIAATLVIGGVLCGRIYNFLCEFRELRMDTI